MRGKESETDEKCVKDLLRFHELRFLDTYPILPGIILAIISMDEGGHNNHHFYANSTD